MNLPQKYCVIPFAPMVSFPIFWPMQNATIWYALNVLKHVIQPLICMGDCFDIFLFSALDTFSQLKIYDFCSKCSLNKLCIPIERSSQDLNRTFINLYRVGHYVPILVHSATNWILTGTTNSLNTPPSYQRFYQYLMSKKMLAFEEKKFITILRTKFTPTCSDLYLFKYLLSKY